MRRERLPGVKYPIEPFALRRPEDDVNMVRHYAPRVQRVTSVLEVVQVLHDGIREARIAQMAFAILGMQFLVEPNCERLFDVETFDGCWLAQPARALTRHGYALVVQSLQNVAWKRIV